jgi:hypothetical protein
MTGGLYIEAWTRVAEEGEAKNRRQCDEIAVGSAPSKILARS